MASRNRGKPKPRLRNLSRQPPTREEIDALEKTFEATQPIARAILGTVLIEHQLEEAIRSRLPRNDDDTWMLLTDDKGPLGTLFMKIELGYALRLYNNQVKETLHIIRAVRNAFAHSKRLISFDNDLVLQELRRLPSCEKTNEKVYISKRQIRDCLRAKDGLEMWTCLIYALQAAFYRMQAREASEKARTLSRANNRLEKEAEGLRLQVDALQRQAELAELYSRNPLLSPLLGGDFLGLHQLRQSDDPTTEVPSASQPAHLSIPPKR